MREGRKSGFFHVKLWIIRIRDTRIKRDDKSIQKREGERKICRGK